MTALESSPSSSSWPQYQQQQQQQQQQQGRPRRRILPCVEWNQIHAECLLGSGSFAAVYAVTVDGDEELEHAPADKQSWTSSSGSLSIGSDSSHSFASTSTSGTTSTSSSTSTSSTSSGVYALKTLREEVLQSSRKERQYASHDLTKEARLLSSLPAHPHIVRLCGLSTDFWAAGFDLSTNTQSRRYLLLEKLDTTLWEKLQRWKKRQKQKAATKAAKTAITAATAAAADQETTSTAAAVGALQEQQQSVELDRLVEAGALGIAHALQVLHAHGMIYRDLKPDNIGYDNDNCAKLFDFGLARRMETHPAKLMTSMVGTLRYMAPEVATTDRRYNQSADIYSWGMLVGEILTLEKPHRKATSMEELRQWVRHGAPNHHHHRASPQKRIQSPRLQQIVAACTSRQANQRPDWNDILSQLQQAICHQQTSQPQ